MSLPILCLDFDGVIHSYTSPWQGAAKIVDPPVPGAIDFIREAMKHFLLCIYSSRSGQPGGIEAMKDWLLDNGCEPEVIRAIAWPVSKPAAFLTIDDRALTFTGTWPDAAKLKEFKPWNKGGDEGKRCTVCGFIVDTNYKVEFPQS